MIVVTQDLKDTLKKHPHIEVVHFNSRGQHFFQAHTHIGEDGKTALYSNYRKQNVRKSTDKEDAPTKLIITTKSENLITDSVPSSDILSRPVDTELSSDQAKQVADENASLKKQIEELKAKQAENDALKKELEALKAGSEDTANSEEKRPVEKANRK